MDLLGIVKLQCTSVLDWRILSFTQCFKLNDTLQGYQDLRLFRLPNTWKQECLTFLHIVGTFSSGAIEKGNVDYEKASLPS